MDLAIAIVTAALASVLALTVLSVGWWAISRAMSLIKRLVLLGLAAGVGFGVFTLALTALVLLRA